MNNITKFHGEDAALEQILMESLGADPDFWDELSRLEEEHGAYHAQPEPCEDEE